MLLKPERIFSLRKITQCNKPIFQISVPVKDMSIFEKSKLCKFIRIDAYEERAIFDVYDDMNKIKKIHKATDINYIKFYDQSGNNWATTMNEDNIKK